MCGIEQKLILSQVLKWCWIQTGQTTV